MLFTSGTKQKKKLANQVFDWFASQNDLDSIEVEVFHTDLTDDGVFGWCEQSDENEFLISIHNDLKSDDYIITLLHELVHVVQSLRGLFDDELREQEAHQLESILFNQFTAAN
jgi:Zn-dependent peptidase ImmA (M78 family)